MEHNVQFEQLFSIKETKYCFLTILLNRRRFVIAVASLLNFSCHSSPYSRTLAYGSGQTERV